MFVPTNFRQFHLLKLLVMRVLIIFQMIALIATTILFWMYVPLILLDIQFTRSYGFYMNSEAYPGDANLFTYAFHELLAELEI